MISTPIYEMIIFDWDGTAATDRLSPIGELKSTLDELLKEGAICAIVTGTNLENILKQGIQDLSPLAKQGLHICTNRGSEVFDFDSSGNPQLIFRRQATAVENLALDQAASELHERLDSQGMRTEVIFNRLNRRKVDLIPEPEWASPKKARFQELLLAVQKRMRSSGFMGGIPELVVIGDKIAHQSGLSSPKITSDIKHIEIGLTDKGDSAAWIAKSIITPGKIPMSKVCIWGDEFGSLGSLPGSDALMRAPDLEGASFFSVGVEPEGVPAWVQPLGGGPVRFIRFLRDQARLRRGRRDHLGLAPTRDPSWLIEQEGFDPSRERLMETLFAVSNGNLGVRGASDFPVPAAQADLFIAGVYDQRVASQPYSEVELMDSSGTSESHETEIVPFPFPFHFSIKANETRLNAGNTNRLKHRRRLDLKQGAYFEENLLESNPSHSGHKIRTSSFRICSHSDPHLLIQQIRIEGQIESGNVEIDLSLAPDNLTELYPHLQKIEEYPPALLGQIATPLLFRTIGSNEFIALVGRVTVNGRETQSSKAPIVLTASGSILIERRVSVFRKKSGAAAVASALAHSKSLPSSIAVNIAQHVKKWTDFWAATDIELPKAPGPTDALRFGLYHLQSSAALSPNYSIPAKALTGRAYEGHIFWDTEIFIFPFFLYTEPEIARQLLLYRYQTLPGARKRADDMGFRGACYAWESTVTGADATPSFVSISGKSSAEDGKIPIFTGTQELHITADVAWAVFKYWDATLDQSFMCDYGVEILIETARFWVGRLTLSGSLYHLNEIVGPDEYHHGVSDNAFTNWMVRFNLDVAIQMVTWISKEHPESWAKLSSNLKLTSTEIASWRDVLKRLYVPEPNSSGVIEQFEGFFGLTPIALSPNDKTRAPISRLFDWKSIDKTRIVKQADVLMIPFLFPDQLPIEIIRANYAYYEPMTDHGSSLSPCVHAAIAARIGKMDDALRYWRESVYFDLHDTMFNSQLGIHAAAIGGTWQALVFHLLNVRLTENGIHFDERAAALLPAEWNGLTMKLKFRGQTHFLVLSSGKLNKTKQEAA